MQHQKRRAHKQTTSETDAVSSGAKVWGVGGGKPEAKHTESAVSTFYGTAVTVLRAVLTHTAWNQ